MNVSSRSKIPNGSWISLAISYSFIQKRYIIKKMRSFASINELSTRQIREYMYTELDRLNRTDFVETLEKIIDKKFNDFDGFSFAIDGRWGCGKTFIVNMLQERIKNKYLVIKYNCWKYDYYDEPVLAIMSVIADSLNKIADEEDPPEFVNEGTFKNIAKFLVEVGAILFEAGTNINLQRILELGGEVINAEYKEKLSKDFDSKGSLAKTIDLIVMALCLAHSEKKVLFIVDELDRCLPEYAIKVLERLHHVNEGSKFVTMLSINKNELAGSIEKVFGKRESKENFVDYYLQKFVGTIIPVPVGKPTNTLLDKFKLCREYFDLNSFFAADFQAFVTDVLGTLPIRSIEIIDKQIHVINALVTSSANKPTEVAFCVAVLRVFEKIITKGEIIAKSSDVEYSILLKFINSAPMNYNENAFNEALLKWSTTSCYEAPRRNGGFVGYTTNSNKLQDFVKAFLVNGKSFLVLRQHFVPQDAKYLNEFSIWLNRFL